MEEERIVCPECGSSNIRRDDKRGEIFCRDCGIIIDEIIDPGPEWRRFAKEEKPRAGGLIRTGPPVSGSEELHTLIDLKMEDGHGKKIRGGGKRRDIYSMRRLQNIISHQARKEKENMEALHRYLDEAISELGINERKLREEIHRYLSSLKGLASHHPRIPFIFALVYVVASNNNIISYRSLLNKCNEYARKKKYQKEISSKWMRKMIREIRKELGMYSLPRTPENWISYLSSQNNSINLIKEEALEIVRIVKEISESYLSDKNPAVIATTAIYIAAEKRGIPLTQEEITNLAGVTPVSLRNRYKDIMKFLSAYKKSSRD